MWELLQVLMSKPEIREAKQQFILLRCSRSSNAILSSKFSRKAKQLSTLALIQLFRHFFRVQLTFSKQTSTKHYISASHCPITAQLSVKHCTLFSGFNGESAPELSAYTRCLLGPFLKVSSPCEFQSKKSPPLIYSCLLSISVFAVSISGVHYKVGTGVFG